MPGTRTIKATWLEKKQLFLELLPSVERNWDKCFSSAPSAGLTYLPVPPLANLGNPWKYTLLESSPCETEQGKGGEWI